MFMLSCNLGHKTIIINHVKRKLEQIKHIETNMKYITRSIQNKINDL